MADKDRLEPGERDPSDPDRRIFCKSGRESHGDWSAISVEGLRARPEARRTGASEQNADADLPLIAWGEAHRTRLVRRRRQLRTAALVALGASALALTLAVPPAPRLVWNASSSVRVGLYRVWPGTRVAVGDMVVVRLPRAARALAARRRYLPGNVPAVKRIAATAGARVCARGAAISIDGVRAATRLAADRRGRPLPWWHGCRTLGSNKIFLLVKGSPDSFDGRYFGPSQRGDVIGRARLLWSPAAASPRRD
jgi:conjugative transfer signal peptidase TraF